MNSDESQTVRIAPAPITTGLLSGKIAVIVGASRGIGAATARALAQAGATTVLAARDEHGLAAVVREIEHIGGRALAVPTDIGEPAQVERLVQHTLVAYGRLDVAFNNAGGGPAPKPLAEVTLKAFDEAVRVNLRGTFLAMKYEIAAMLASGGGAIVNMSSTAGLRGVPGIGAYVATKHAILGLTKSAALDYAASNIRVNAVAPGPILTDRLSALPEPAREQVSRAVPMRRIGQPEEVAATVAWLCSDQAAFITGATFAIDGGRMAAGA